MSFFRARCVVGILLAHAAACESGPKCDGSGGIEVDGLCQCPGGTVEQHGACVSTSNASASDAESMHASGDSSAPTSNSNGHITLSGSDASYDQGDATRNDAGTGEGRDGGNSTHGDASLKCAPSGAFTAEYVERRGGSCNAGTDTFSLTLHGTLMNAVVSDDACVFVSSHLSDDGCTFDYDELCPVDSSAPDQHWHEVGTLRMTSPTHIEGSAHVKVEEGGGVDCEADVDIGIDANAP